jgi:phosphate uptake regulator
MRFFRGHGRDGLQHVQQQLLEMLSLDRVAFDAATSTLLAGGDAAEVGPKLRDTDAQVNELEREIRRELVVHASVHGAGDIAAVLVYMSIVKDVERIGDYAKNIYDLAAGGVDFGAVSDRPTMLEYRDRTAEMITEAGVIFAEDDQERAHALLNEADTMLDAFDELVNALVVSDGIARDAVPRALFYRHLKRIVAHLMNLLSAVVVPVVRLDYLDETDIDDV